MFTRLKITNYQSIADADIDLAPFTVIVGRNRSGKSATLRALRALLFNQTGTGFIRRGMSSCEVLLETSEGDCIRWTKNKTTAEYGLFHFKEERRFTKLGGAVPEEVQQATGVRAVEVDSTLTLYPQVHTQGEYAFLVDRSAGQAARALAKMTRLDVVVKAQQLCKSVVRDAKTRLGAVLSLITMTEQEIDEFPNIEKWRLELQAISEKSAALGEEVSLYSQGSLAYSGIVQNETDAERYLPDAPILLEVDAAITLLADVKALAEQLNQSLPPSVPDITPLVEQVATWEEGINALLDHDEAGEIEDWVEEKLVELAGEQEEVEQQLSEFEGTTCPICGGIIESLKDSSYQ